MIVYYYQKEEHTMLKNRKILMLLCAAFVLCLVTSLCLTACGGSDTAETEQPAAEETQPEPEPEAQPTEEQPAEDQGTGDADLIGEEKALAIALKDAGVNKDDLSMSIVDLDMDDGKQEYDVQFNVGTTEYEYSVDAYSGKILQRDKDIDNDNDDYDDDND